MAILLPELLPQVSISQVLFAILGSWEFEPVLNPASLASKIAYVSLEMPQKMKWAVLELPMGELNLSRVMLAFLSVVMLSPRKYRHVLILGFQKQN